MKKQYCIICGKPLNSGIILNGKGICNDCEKRMINTKMNTDFYEFYKDCIRKNLVHTIIKDEEIKCQNYQL
ncbi:protein CsfB [Clostridium niameyense]|uniref:Protein CsfB n=1 Tax=Clostridium niameyense TaxID=1622073 RepID=A0A6M0RAU7_9CLOT|nr:sigma factor G inhibitor Gin [Clostridium niameyense]NEZ47342.1 protein CsfB [Clostridium niameyense]